MSIGDAASVVAIVIAFVALYRTRKKVEVENKYNEVASKLALLQIEVLEKERENQTEVRLAVYFYLDHVGTYRLALRNMSNVPAFNVDLDVMDPKSRRSVIMETDRTGKLPVRTLHPEEEVYLMAPIHLGMPSQFEARLSWEDNDGRRSVENRLVSLP